MHRTERVELTVVAVVTDAQGRILVEDRQDPEWGGLYFPGGHVEPGESFVEAAIRETREETGMTIEHPALCGIKQFPIEGGRYIVLYFRADGASGTLRSSREGPVFWCAPDELKNYRLAEDFYEVLRLSGSPDLSELRWTQDETGAEKLVIL